MISVSILIPCFQERDFVRPCLESVLAFEIPAGAKVIEIIVIDGGSSDGTRGIVGELAMADPRIRLVDNPGRIQSMGLNIALRIATGEYVVRLDAHSSYPRDYLALTLETSLRTGCDNAGGLVITQPRGTGYQAALIQALTTHKFGVGDSGFRTGWSRERALIYVLLARAWNLRLGKGAPHLLLSSGRCAADLEPPDGERRCLPRDRIRAGRDCEQPDADRRRRERGGRVVHGAADGVAHARQGALTRRGSCA